ncbi:transposase, partial [Smithella sp. F21]
WQIARDNKGAKVNWQFTAEDARIKLRRLYPTLDS